MEAKINVAEILKDKPVNTKLYSPLFGDVYFSHVKDSIINVEHHTGVSKFFNSGRYYNYDESEPLLFPSMEMRDWSKFTWKKGDLLAGAFGALCIFEKWANDDYTKFDSKFVTPKDRGTTFEIEDWCKVTNKAVIKQYISDIEENNGGKLNITTLEIEKAQPEFKDGDIAFADYGNRQDVFIVSDKTDLYEGYSSFISLDLRGLTLSMGYRTCFFKKNLCELRLATEEEKQQLFDALAKEGKRWDAEKKQIVDLKPKVEFKPFDKVVIRDKEDLVWFADLFSHIDKENNRFACVGNFWNVCLPYNEETAKLIGTTNNVEG